MSLYHKIIAIYPELENTNAFTYDETIILRNDSDGFGEYVQTWNYSKPVPNGIKLGK